MEIFQSLIIFVIGLCCGSFVNMLVYRTEIKYKLTKNKNTISKNKENRSFCDYCGKQLSWYENIPVVSWMVLKGKTKCCHKKLPIQYPLVEITMGLLFLIFNFKFLIFNQFLIINLIILTLLIFATVFDLKHMILPDFSTVLLVAGALVLWYAGHFGERNYIYSALGAFLFLLILHVVTKGKGMGFGDVKLAIFMGLYLGYPKIVIAFYFAFVTGAIVGIVLIALKKLKRNSHIPFGPFLIAGTIVASLIGDKILYYVYRWF